MQVKINKSSPKGFINIIPSKSYFHRYILALLLSNNNGYIDVNDCKFELSKDILATLNATKFFGREYKIYDDKVEFTKTKDSDYVIDTIESGSTLRFLIPICIAIKGKGAFKGTERLIERGIGIYEKLFKEMGINVNITKNTINCDGFLKPGEYTIEGNISSQFATGLLFALPLLDGDSLLTITKPITSLPYIDITLDVLRKSGIEITVIDNKYYIKGNQKYSLSHALVEGDWSNSAFILALKYIGFDVTVLGLNENSLQGDRKCLECFEKLKESFCKIDISNIIDLGPVLFTLASLLHGAHFTGTKRLLIKESNRLNCMLDELSKFNVKYDLISDDEVIIYKNNYDNKQLIFDSHNDHRLAMSLALICILYGGVINNSEAVNKSYKSFFEDLKTLGVEVIYE